MGWNNSIFPLLIVTSGSGFTGFFVYSPAPGAGNMIASITAQAGTDPYGNAYQAGITSYLGSTTFMEILSGQVQFQSTGDTVQAQLAAGGGSMTLASGTGSVAGRAQVTLSLLQSLVVADAPRVVLTSNSSVAPVLGFTQQAATPAAAAVDRPSLTWLPSTNHLSEIDPADGNTYALQRLSVSNTSNFPGNSTSPLAITGLQISKVAASTSYRVTGMINIAQGTVTSGQRIAFSGSCTVTSMRISGRYADTTALTQGNPIEITALAGTPQAQNMTANDIYDFWFDGIINVNAAGTFGPTIQNLTSGDTCTIGANSFMDLMPV